MRVLPLRGSHVTVESSESGGRRDTGASLDSVGASSGSLSPLEPPSPLFPPDGSSSESSLTSEVFLNVLKLNQNRKRQENRYGTLPLTPAFESVISFLCKDYRCLKLVETVTKIDQTLKIIDSNM